MEGPVVFGCGEAVVDPSIDVTVTSDGGGTSPGCDATDATPVAVIESTATTAINQVPGKGADPSDEGLSGRSLTLIVVTIPPIVADRYDHGHQCHRGHPVT